MQKKLLSRNFKKSFVCMRYFEGYGYDKDKNTEKQMRNLMVWWIPSERNLHFNISCPHSKSYGEKYVSYIFLTVTSGSVVVNQMSPVERNQTSRKNDQPPEKANMRMIFVRQPLCQNSPENTKR